MKKMLTEIETTKRRVNAWNSPSSPLVREPGVHRAEARRAGARGDLPAEEDQGEKGRRGEGRGGRRGGRGGRGSRTRRLKQSFSSVSHCLPLVRRLIAFLSVSQPLPPSVVRVAHLRCAVRPGGSETTDVNCDRRYIEFHKHTTLRYRERQSLRVKRCRSTSSGGHRSAASGGQSEKSVRYLSVLCVSTPERKPSIRRLSRDQYAL